MTNSALQKLTDLDLLFAKTGHVLLSKRRVNDHRNHFMINLHKSNEAELGFRLVTPRSAFRWATDCIMELAKSRKQKNNPNDTYSRPKVIVLSQEILVNNL